MIRARPSFITALVLAVATLLFASASHAATGTTQHTWTNPTQYVDNSALSPTDIQGYKFVCTFMPTGATTAVPCTGLTPTQISTGAQTSASTTFTYPASGGTACYQVVVTAGGVDSPPSALTAQSCKTFAALQPKAPTNVTITVTVSANLPKGVTIDTKIAQVKKVAYNGLGQ